MRFENDYLSWLLLIIPLVAVLFYGQYRAKKKAFSKALHPDTWSLVIPSLSMTRKFWRRVLLILALSGILFCLLRPQYGVTLEKTHRKGRTLLIACDTSLSMMAQDVKPTRLDHAKEEVRTLIQSLQGDAVGFMVFAGNAFLQCPFTVDYGAFQLFLDDVSVGAVSTPGTNLSAAIQEAIKAFSKQKTSNKQFILITDGETTDGPDPIEAAKEAAAQGIHIYTIGIGAPNGEPIPLYAPDGSLQGYKKDAQGQVVLSKLNEAVLQQIAQVTGGHYFLSNDQSVVADQLYRELNPQTQESKEGQMIVHHQDRYQIFLFGVFLCLILEMLISERKRLKKRAWPKLPFFRVFLGFMCLHSVVHAATIPDYFHNEKAIKHLNHQRYSQAQTILEKLQAKSGVGAQVGYNLGNVLYKQGHFDQAQAAYTQAGLKLNQKEKSKAFYNLGNTAFMQDQYEQAIDAYRGALKLNPKDKNAKYNLELALMRLKQDKKKQKPKEQKQNKPEDKKGKGSGHSAAQQQEKENHAKGLLGALEQREKEARRQHRPKPKTERKVDKDW